MIVPVIVAKQREHKKSSSKRVNVLGVVITMFCKTFKNNIIVCKKTVVTSSKTLFEKKRERWHNYKQIVKCLRLGKFFCCF